MMIQSHVSSAHRTESSKRDQSADAQSDQSEQGFRQIQFESHLRSSPPSSLRFALAMELIAEELIAE
jgi:hypothetical protein